MKRTTILLFLLIGFSTLFAQVTVKNDSIIKTWSKTGIINFLLNQSSFSNWVSGGDNTTAGNLNLTYQFNYKKGSWNWDNRIDASYGLSKTKSNGTRKTDDKIILNTLLGKKAKMHWYYSFFTNFQTQFTNGYDYAKDPNGIMPISKLFAPAYLTFGPGLLWKKSDNFKFNFTPVTSKITFVSDTTLSSIGAFGVKPGKKSNYEIGFYASGYLKTKIMDNVTIENILNIYSNYFKNPQNVDFDYTMNIVMSVNKYLSTNLNFQTIYNDKAIGRLQVKEVFGLGVNYKF